MIEIAGQIVTTTIASDLERDGMCLEVSNAAEELLFEIFYSDATGQLTFSAWQEGLSIELVAWAIAYARERLTPVGE